MIYLPACREKEYNIDMNQRIDAVFENGVFRPERPLDIANGERVSLSIESKANSTHDLSDVEDLLDLEFMESCRQRSGHSPSLEEVRNMLSVFDGSLADRISEERDER
jgi:predicted DNA-binding antitoxin AbrB/MazE fold protein